MATLPCAQRAGPWRGSFAALAEDSSPASCVSHRSTSPTSAFHTRAQAQTSCVRPCELDLAAKPAMTGYPGMSTSHSGSFSPGSASTSSLYVPSPNHLVTTPGDHMRLQECRRLGSGAFPASSPMATVRESAAAGCLPNSHDAIPTEPVQTSLDMAPAPTRQDAGYSVSPVASEAQSWTVVQQPRRKEKATKMAEDVPPTVPMEPTSTQWSDPYDTGDCIDLAYDQVHFFERSGGRDAKQSWSASARRQTAYAVQKRQQQRVTQAAMM